MVTLVASQRGCIGTSGGVLAKHVFGRSLESGRWFCVGMFDRNVGSVAVKVF